MGAAVYSSRTTWQSGCAGLASAWQAAPFAADCHPEAEHLLPIHVAAGNDIGRRVFSDRLMGKTISADQFG